ncbi:MAG: alpha/beta hydrolase [Chitinophagaceae bacterium]
MRLSQRVVLYYIRTRIGLLASFSKKAAAKKALELFCTPQYRNKKKLPRIFEAAEKISFSFHGTVIQGYRWNKTSPKKLLILHGFESSVINFDRYISPLIKKDYCILAFDAPAHGRSTGKRINVAIYKELINYINAQYGPVTNFIAHSMGGLALSVTIEEWEHDASYKLVLIAPATETTTAANSLFKLLRLNNSIRKEFDSLIHQAGHNPISWFSVSRAAANIKANVLWFHDRDDELTPLSDVLPVMGQQYQNFTFHITDGLGHRRIYRDNKVSSAIIDFF